ncbi:hypothetical protein TcasGA2_TC008463 [Tribolium castaneum]|uniref:Uncharacterized protein n=1 Tax=Tribolium castaneum TaxID=7070 RepID=D2A247_TRICA|nr:hypothetical protein TcasGA2_TC008463 [Tribolium castaneum]
MIHKTMAGHTFGIIYYINTCLFNAFWDMENYVLVNVDVTARALMQTSIIRNMLTLLSDSHSYANDMLREHLSIKLWIRDKSALM